MIIKAIANIIFILSISFGISYNTKNTYVKVPLSPPNIVFPIVWTILYILLGIYVSKLESEISIFLFYIMLSINLLWTTVYFKIKKLSLAALMIIVMQIITLLLFITEESGKLLLLPYIFWLFFAFYLNISTIIYKS